MYITILGDRWPFHTTNTVENYVSKTQYFIFRSYLYLCKPDHAFGYHGYGDCSNGFKASTSYSMKITVLWLSRFLKWKSSCVWQACTCAVVYRQMCGCLLADMLVKCTHTEELELLDMHFKNARTDALHSRTWYVIIILSLFSRDWLEAFPRRQQVSLSLCLVLSSCYMSLIILLQQTQWTGQGSRKIVCSVKECTQPSQGMSLWSDSWCVFDFVTLQLRAIMLRMI